MTKEELAMERNEVREILECFSEELSQSNLDKLSRVFCIINGDEKRIAELEAENERIKTKYYELQDELKKVRLALIKERTANIMNYGKGGVEMFDSMFEILKGVSN